jgi:Putative auto-transporter adhesin, head GIN domain
MKRTIAKRLFAVSGAALLTGLAACADVIGVGGTQGSGNVSTQTRDVHGFDSIVMAGTGKLTITQGNGESLMVRSDDNILPLLISNVSGGILTLATKSGSSIRPTEITYVLTVRTLKKVEVTGEGDVSASGIVTGSLDTTVKGTGHIVLSGRADSQSVHIKGTAAYDSSSLQSQKATVSISGDGDVLLRASDTLDVQIDGVGKVRYLGNPRITQRISGGGSVQHQ